MGSGEHYCLRWNNHQSNLLGVFSQLLEDGSLVDVTLACAEEGHSIRAHKVVLSACSSYFQTLFVAHPARHPIVILKDVCFKELRTLVEFMYKGEVNVEYCQLSALLKTAESLKVKGLAEMTNLSSSEKDRDHDRDRESRERDKDRDRDRDKDRDKEKEREQDRDRDREQRNRDQDKDRERDREREREKEQRERDQDRDQERERRRERGDREREQQDRDREQNQEREREREKVREWEREESRREEELQRLHQQVSQPQHLLPRHRHSQSGPLSVPSPGPVRSANGVNLMIPDSPLTAELLAGHAGHPGHPLTPLGLPHPMPLPLTHHHSRLLNSSPDSPPRPPSHSRSLSPPPSKKLARSRLDSSCDGDDSCQDQGGAIDPGSPDEADMMANSPMSTCSAEPNDMTMATNLSNPSNSNNNNNNGIPATLAGCSGCPPGVCGLPSGGPSPLSLVQPPPCSSAASSRLASPLALAASPIPGPSGMPPVQQVPLSLKKEVDWDHRDDKSIAGESSSDYSRHQQDSESQGLGVRGGGSEGSAADRCSSPPRLFQCMYCGASFPHQSKLTRHILSHSLETLKFREQLALQPPPGLSLLPGTLEPLNLMESPLAGVSHYHDGPLMELDGNPGAPNAVLCKFCGKSFPDVGSLITHLPAHTGDRPFKCEFCGKAFKLRHHMKDHCRVHTGERPFRCSLCGKTFSRSTILKAHEKTHYPKYVRKFLSPNSPVEAGEEAQQP